jgi:Fe(3+) dicitrate transport protein
MRDADRAARIASAYDMIAMRIILKSKRMHYLPLSAAILAALTSSFALAESTSDDRELKRKTAPVVRVEVVADAPNQSRATGSIAVLDREELDRARVLTTNEALRKLPGLNVRDEEGFGMRPNFGVRGLNPTRSTKVLILEDGLPAAYAPYGDNASYYAAPIDRYRRIEVSKGVNMLRFGPQTIGGVINYLTPDPTIERSGKVFLSGGSRNYLNAHGQISGAGFLLDAVQKRGDGARDNTELDVRDLNGKWTQEFAGNQALTAKLGYFREDSIVTYSGITDRELANFGAEYNPFANDEFDTERYGGSLAHRVQFNDAASLTTSLYGFKFARDWWRQSSSTTDGQCGAGFTNARLAGQAVNVASCNSAQGRLRSYYTYGVEPRLQLTHGFGGVESLLNVGIRGHIERQNRFQVNANSPLGRSGTFAENNLRKTQAWSGFIENQMTVGRFSIEPALRFERIENERFNKLNGRSGNDTLKEWIPGIGASFEVQANQVIYAGFHRGFAPPRTEDLIDNNGGSVDIDAERSLNAELGLRGAADRFEYEVTAFQNDFSRQVAVGSIASGATPLAVGETLYRGIEGVAKLELAELRIGDFEPYLRANLTWLPTARQETPLRAVANGQAVAGSAAGKRLPYAPKQFGSLAVGAQSATLDLSLEVQHLGSQFADFANTVDAPVSGNGQVGQLGAYSVLNAVVNWQPASLPFGVFVAGKNLTDKTYIVDRTRGILSGQPRTVQLGVSWSL